MKLHYTKLIFIALLVWAYSSGCNVINPSETVPTYIHIDSFQFVPGNYNVTGSSTHKITSVWAYYNGSPIGVFSLPATIPVIAKGNGTMSFIPGVSMDGMSSYQTQYPYYLPDSASLTAQPGKIITMVPKSAYVSSTVFLMIENFDVTTSFVKDPESLCDTTITRVGNVGGVNSGLVEEGGGSGYIHLGTTNDSAQSLTKLTYTIPIGHTYLELDYKCNTTFYVGIRAYNNSTGSTQPVSTVNWLMGVRPTPYDSTTGKYPWNKVYVSLESFVGANQTTSNTVSFAIYIKAAVDAGNQSGYVSLDNLKILSF
ncbi:MAG: hypothetical protein WCG87_08100 [Bacteroidota bacterium]